MFNNMNNKYHKFKATLNNDTFKNIKEILNKEISKIIDKLEDKINQFCQDENLLQEQISELKIQNIAIAASCEEVEQRS